MLWEMGNTRRTKKLLNVTCEFVTKRDKFDSLGQDTEAIFETGYFVVAPFETLKNDLYMV